MVQTINAAELADLLGSNAQVIDVIDVREHNDFDAGHIAGSRVVPLETFRADPDAVLVKGSTLVFVCAKGVRSLAAAKLADRFGYDHVYSLDGGVKSWIGQGMPVRVDRAAAA